MGLLFLFVIGLFIGSFLNVLVDRLPKEEDVIRGRSRCEKCKKELKWYDLIPLLSFIVLQGKCRYCRTRLSYYYPIIELTTGILFMITGCFVLANFQFAIFDSQLLINFFYYLFITSSLIVVFFADLKYGIIPDKVVFSAIGVSFLYFAFGGERMILPHLLSALAAGLFFLILALVKIRGHQGMGFGDVKFALLMGLVLGFPGIVTALYIAFLTGAAIGCILIIWKRKKMLGTTLPFGPFLVLGMFLTMFWGEFILQKITSALAL